MTSQKALRERDLAQAEDHVLQGMQHIAHQREIIAELEGHGHDISTAKAFLHQLEQLQATHLAHRDRLRRELDEDIAGISGAL